MSKALTDVATRHQVHLEGLKSSEAARFAEYLKRIDRDLRKRLAGTELTEFSRARLEKILVEINKSLKAVFTEFEDELTGSLLEIGGYESQFEAKSLSAAVGFESVIPSSNQVRAAVLSMPLSVRGTNGGKLLEPFIADWSKAERTKLIGVIRQGYFEGQTNSQMVQALRGTRATGFRDGVFATSARNAEAIVRTSVQHVASSARMATWQQNSDIMDGYEWVSTLDSKTSAQCRSLDGQVFKMNHGPRPPIHIRCRSTTVAKLSGEFDFLKEGQTRASKDGPVSSSTSYYDWLGNQSAAFQNDAIGPARGALLRNGGLTSKQFAKLNLGRNFKPLTLEQMRKKEPLAFDKAFN